MLFVSLLSFGVHALHVVVGSELHAATTEIRGAKQNLSADHLTSHSAQPSLCMCIVTLFDSFAVCSATLH